MGINGKQGHDLWNQIQILERTFNAFQKEFRAPGFFTSLLLVQIGLQYVLIGYSRHLNMGDLILFIFFFVNSSSCIFMNYTLASWIYSHSKHLIGKWRRLSPNKTRRGLHLKQLRAYRPLRVQFGSNFVDEGTPLVVQNFILVQTVNLLLMRN